MTIINLDNVRFCYIDRGSLRETHGHIMLACELQYVPPANYTVRGESALYSGGDLEDLKHLENQ
jgi:hypothetical protein